MDTLLSSIELTRGTTLKLECADLATVRLVDGAAWLSASHLSVYMHPGKPIAVNGGGPTLVYALQDSSLSVEGAEQCRIELRRRGEVAAAPEDVKRALFVALLREHAEKHRREG